jgi:hypothetical protein
MEWRVARWLVPAVSSILRKVQSTMKLGRLNLHNCRMFPVPYIGNNKPDQQTYQSHRRRSSIAKAQRSRGRTSCTELKQAPQTVVAGCDMIYTPIGKRNIRGTFCIGFQKGIVNTLRSLVSTWLSTGIRQLALRSFVDE